MSNIYGRQVILPLTNKSGGGVVAGDVVIIDSANNDAFTTTTSAGVTTPIGVAQEAIANNATGRVLVEGYAALVNVNASVTRLHYGTTHTVAKQATDAGATRTAGTFCCFLSSGATPDALVFPVDLAGAALTNPMSAVGDLIRGGTLGAPTRLAASATAGQFLMNGGTATAPAWASRELDYVQFTGGVNCTATTEATANTIVTSSSVTYDGATPVYIEFFSTDVTPGTTFILLWLYDGASSIGRIATLVNRQAAHPAVRITPSNASHTYSVRGSVDAGTGSAAAGAGGNGVIYPGFIRITRAI